MNKLELSIYPEPVLRLQADPVLHVGEHERQLLKSMFKCVWNWNGVGLAAPQVGFSSRLFVAEAEGMKLALANPEILECAGFDTLTEGCLSLPDQAVPVSRPASVWVRALDIENKEVELKFDGILARIVQHEIDHLNGKLIIDSSHSVERAGHHR